MRLVLLRCKRRERVDREWVLSKIMSTLHMGLASVYLGEMIAAIHSDSKESECSATYEHESATHTMPTPAPSY